MIPSTMLYGLLLGLALTGWAHFLDKGFRALKMPTRWAWILAMAGTSLEMDDEILLGGFAGGSTGRNHRDL